MIQSNLFDAEVLPVTPARDSDPDTSHLASRLGRLKRGSIRARLAVVYAECALEVGFGLSDESAACLAGLDPGAGTWKRCSELRAAGYIVDTGDRIVGSEGALVMVCRMPSDVAREILR